MVMTVKPLPAAVVDNTGLVRAEGLLVAQRPLNEDSIYVVFFSIHMVLTKLPWMKKS